MRERFSPWFPPFCTNKIHFVFKGTKRFSFCTFFSFSFCVWTLSVCYIFCTEAHNCHSVPLLRLFFLFFLTLLDQFFPRTCTLTIELAIWFYYRLQSDVIKYFLSFVVSFYDCCCDHSCVSFSRSLTHVLCIISRKRRFFYVSILIGSLLIYIAMHVLDTRTDIGKKEEKRRKVSKSTSFKVL